MVSLPLRYQSSAMFRRILLCSVAAPSRTLVVYIDALLFHAFILPFHNHNPKTSASSTSRRAHSIREHPIIIIILKSSQLPQTSTSLVQQAIPSTIPSTRPSKIRQPLSIHTLQHRIKTRSTKSHQNKPHLSHTLQNQTRPQHKHNACNGHQEAHSS